MRRQEEDAEEKRNLERCRNRCDGDGEIGRRDICPCLNLFCVWVLSMNPCLFEHASKTSFYNPYGNTLFKTGVLGLKNM